MDPDRIAPEHLVALAYYQEAMDALPRVWECADVYANENWSPHGPEHIGDESGEIWHIYCVCSLTAIWAMQLIASSFGENATASSVPHCS
jgi:hypothetical protein